MATLKGHVYSKRSQHLKLEVFCGSENYCSSLSRGYNGKSIFGSAQLDSMRVSMAKIASHTSVYIRAAR